MLRPKTIATVLTILLAAAPASDAGEHPAHPSGKQMITVKSGSYVPFSKLDNGKTKVFVPTYLMDAQPITNGEFLNFVKSNPRWRKSQIRSVFADKSYLRDWTDDLHPCSHKDLSAPVTYVSWFAARAYAEWAHKRLPTVDQWEFAMKQRMFNSINCNLWEWVEDFNSLLPDEESQDSGDGSSILTCGGGSVNVTDPSDYAAFLRFAFRSALKATYCLPNLGFRCVRNVNEIVKVTK
ncbi:MAG TPA: formylglycine-generating enzyme family protein [Candidatus Kryptonia bacterium]